MKNQPSLFGNPRADFSPDRRHRYTLWRTWGDPDNYVQFICLNPSTADELNDDPTIRRCVNFAKDWGFGAFVMTNLFAWRDTNPKNLPRRVKEGIDIIGEENDRFLVETACFASLIICAWGNDGTLLGRDEQVLKLIHKPLYCLKKKDGCAIAAHPLYLPSASLPVYYSGIEYKLKPDSEYLSCHISKLWVCPKCRGDLHAEVYAGIDYPFICLNCDENFYELECIPKDCA